jgi:predicted transglutaminase-like cysteine proteinase
MSREKFAVAMAVLMVVTLTASAVITGGTMDFEYECDGDGNITVRDTSFGLFTDASWDVRDYSGNEIFSHQGGKEASWGSEGPTSGPNVFRVTLYLRTYAGIERKITKDAVREGLRERDVVWTYTPDMSKPGVGLETYSVKFSIDTSDFLRYKNERIDRAPGSAANADLVRRYVGGTSAADDAFGKIVSQLTVQFEAKHPGGTQEDYVNRIMSFVQQTEYKTDKETMGVAEYWKFPIETLFTGAGDCEDVSILTMALVKAFFHDEISTALVIFWDVGHAMAAVSLSEVPAPIKNPGPESQDISSGWYTKDGKTYYTCETTNERGRVGMIAALLKEVEPDLLIIV